MHALTVYRVERRTSTLSDALRQVPNFAVGCWAWLHNTASITCGGVKAGTNAKVFETKIASNWTGPSTRSLRSAPVPLATHRTVPPSSINPSTLDLPTDVPGADAHRRVSVERCKPCANPHGHGDMPKYLPDGLTQHVLHNLTKYPSYITSLRHNESAPLQRRSRWKRLPKDHQSVRGRGRMIAVTYETHWPGSSRPSWEREMDVQLSRQYILLYSPYGPKGDL